jgi:hypothetical protein
MAVPFGAPIYSQISRVSMRVGKASELPRDEGGFGGVFTRLGLF